MAFSEIHTGMSEVTNWLYDIVWDTIEPFEHYLRFWYAFSQMEAGTIEFGTGATNAAQGIGHITYSL